MNVELMQALTVDGDIMPVIESEHRAWREAWDSDPLLGMSFEDWQWRRLVLFRKRLEAAETNYNELLFAVENKHEGESRHETALRYIRETESRCSGPLTALAGEKA
jgi:hypothetical protein